MKQDVEQIVNVAKIDEKRLPGAVRIIRHSLIKLSS